MKNCPNCGELIGDNAKECFKCHYSYTHRRVITSDEMKNKREEKERAQRQVQEQIEAEQLERQKALEEREASLRKINACYEYRVETITDLYNGAINVVQMQNILADYAKRGWRLHSVFTNELGKNGVTANNVNINATMDQTILVFERYIAEPEKEIEQ